ncbi:MAG: hypothetical protein OES32_09715 [Acidobacteriota bacterium]|nr:hypothetical protein [Acidobacteriota bacterium]
MRKVVLSPDDVRQFQRLRAHDRSTLRDAFHLHLAEEDATEETRRRFRLRRPSEAADFELRVGDLRAFYRVTGDRVEVVLLGKRRGNELIIGGERFVL